MTSTDDRGNTDPELRSFGRRRGRKLSPRQQKLIDEILPDVRAAALAEPSGSVQFSRRLEAAVTASSRPPLWLEIGFGGGEHLISQARENPDVLLIGCEPFIDGVVKVLSELEALSLDNILLHADDARPLLRALPDGCIERCFILFADPWPKKRHVKRRLISGNLLDLLGRVMRPGAELRIATDIPDYSRTLLRAVLDHPRFDWPARTASQWRVRSKDWPETRYEQKASREGRASCYFRFVRT